jgi:glycosyltransferase involved in cell wall biosynthesis
VIENGVDTALYSPGDDRDRYSDPTLLYLGRLRHYKRVDLILRALVRLRENGISTRLLIAGTGDDEGRLRREASRLDLSEDEVHFLGFVSEEKKVELLQRAWVHILTSPKEGWGITIVEAGACGTPTVASDAPGLRDSVRDGETGFLVPHGDTEALAQRVGLLLRDGEMRRRMGIAARTFAATLSWERTSARLAQAIERAVPERSRM